MRCLGGKDWHRSELVMQYTAVLILQFGLVKCDPCSLDEMDMCFEPTSLLQRVRRKLWRLCYVWLKPRAAIQPVSNLPLTGFAMDFLCQCALQFTVWCHLQSCLEQWKHVGNSSRLFQFLQNSLSYYILWTKIYHPRSENAWTILTVQVPTHIKYQTMLMNESVMLKCNISIIKSDCLVVVCIYPLAIVNICYC